MEVMDLSVRKSHQISTFSPQGPYIMPDFPMYYSPPNIHSASAPQSLNHLGLFEQLQYVPTMPMSPSAMRVGSFEDSISTLTRTEVQSPTTSASSDKDSESSFKCSLKIPIKRPFKTLSSTKPGALALVSALDPMFDSEYEEYRKQVLSRVSQEDSNTSSTNKNMRRNVPSNPEKSQDPEYLEKRRKNNEAAKKSREARKSKEDELAIRVAFLEKENLKMKFQLAAIEREKKIILTRKGHI